MNKFFESTETPID
uniref:Uncharacterized protein n=1 Tax=Rhizophora mucronata TaxID=61149 RepID=A0A2P2L6Y8_RHIMU